MEELTQLEAKVIRVAVEEYLEKIQDNPFVSEDIEWTCEGILEDLEMYSDIY